MPSARLSLNRMYAANQRAHGKLKLFSRPESLPNGSVVVDVGSNVGHDLVTFARRRHALSVDNRSTEIHTFEPVNTIRATLMRNVAAFSQIITVHPFGLSNVNKTACFVMQGRRDAKGTRESTKNSSRSTSSRASDADAARTSCTADAGGELVELRDAPSALHRLVAPPRNLSVTLLHVNCEGCEYDVLPALDPLSLARVAAIEVQFHRDVFSDTLERYCRIEAKLLTAGFRLAYRYYFVWELWESMHM